MVITGGIGFFVASLGFLINGINLRRRKEPYVKTLLPGILFLLTSIFMIVGSLLN